MPKSLLIQVPFDSIVATSALDFDLYNQAGTQLFSVGSQLTGEDLQYLRGIGSYRVADELLTVEEFDHEGHIFRFSSNLTTAEQKHRSKELQATSLIDDTFTTSMQEPLDFFWQRLRKGATPDIALCEVVRDRLIAEVTSKVDQIQFLSQIRVRDEFTYSHILDVTALSIALATQAGFSHKEVKEIAMSAILHDLGKLLIPRHIMFKPNRLSEKEFQVMKLHPELGYKMITETLDLPEQIARPALEHQEMYSGGGYPQGLSKDEIHPYSHVVKIADVYDALTSKRPYKESIPSAKALRIMLSEGPKSFHPELLSSFAKLSNFRDLEMSTTQTRA